MSTYKVISESDIVTTKSVLNQLVDILQEDISGSVNRKKYQVFVTGGVGPGVTSSLFQTVYDQDFSYTTSNPVFDMTYGTYFSGSTVTTAKVGVDVKGKYLFPSQSMMMREKIDIYRQFAQQLLGSADARFYSPYDSTSQVDAIDDAIFICFKRLFSRDGIQRDTFAMKLNTSASHLSNNFYLNGVNPSIITDIGASSQRGYTAGGNIGNLVDATKTTNKLGLLYYDRGIAVLNASKVFYNDQIIHGVISAMNSNPAGLTTVSGSFIPGFIVSSSIDDIIDHVCNSRFGSSAETAITFQNITNINSTLFFCRSNAEDFNYSSNPTYTDSDNRIVVIDPGQEDSQSSFTFVTSVGLYDKEDNLLAVAKLSRPIEKSAERDLTIRVRLDF